MSEVIVRKAIKEDCQEIMRLIQELADFEKMPDSVKLNAETLQRDGFETNPPAFQCLVVEDPDETSKLAGYALYNTVYGTWEGKRYWLEDIMITKKHRGNGLGNKLFSALCKKAVEENVVAIRFVVLSWNPAVEFYKKLGMINITETECWQYSKIDKEDIIKCAKLYHEI